MDDIKIPQPETVLGFVRGYRGWFVAQDGHPRLLSTSQSLALPVGEPGPHEAICNSFSTGLMQSFARTAKVIHVSPADNCRCGYYAIYSGGLSTLFDHVGITGTLVIGSVLMSGKVMMGQTGVMRGQVMYIEAMMRPKLGVWGSLRQAIDVGTLFSGRRMHLSELGYSALIKSMRSVADGTAISYKVPVLDEDDFLREYPLNESLVPPPEPQPMQVAISPIRQSSHSIPPVGPVTPWLAPPIYRALWPHWMTGPSPHSSWWAGI